MLLAVCPLLALAPAPFAFATSNMDPTAAELAAITNLNEALAWAGVELELEASLRTSSYRRRARTRRARRRSHAVEQKWCSRCSRSN